MISRVWCLVSTRTVSWGWSGAGPRIKHPCAFARDFFTFFVLQLPDVRKGRSTTEGVLTYHMSYGDLFSGLADIAARFKSIARPVRRFGPQRFRCRHLRACIRPATAAVSIKPSACSATPLNWRLSAVVNSCLIACCDRSIIAFFV